MEFTIKLLAQGAVVSLLLAIVGITGGTLLALALNLLAFSRFAALRTLYHVYIYFARGTPLLVQALLVFYALPAFDLRAGPYVAGSLVLAIYLGALFAEVFRGGVLAIPRAQWESAKSLGLPPTALFRKVVVPLVSRYTLPPYVNVCVMSIKASSVLSIISVWELTLAAREIIERTLDVFSVLSLAALFYFVMCFSIDRLGRRLEYRLMLKGFVGERA
ncbi:MAG: amino acid ABC transporter permease [Candidatus Rokubacteria bacterium]|nr:amino acid ABC transporter permease [Candidatus Rokubacteria bacterium]